MKGFVHIFGKEAAPRVRSGSYADGIAGQSLCLPLAVVGPYVNLPSSDHSKVASDANRFASCFLALCAKALSEAKIELEFKIHFEFCCNMLESWERLVKSTSSALSQKMEHLPLVGQTLLNHQLWRAPKTSKIKLRHKDTHFFRNCKAAQLESLERLVKSTSSALLPKKRASATRQMLPHVSLEEQTLKVLVFPLAKIRHISESAKHSESALSQNKRSICLSVGRRSVTSALESAQNYMKIIIRHKDTYSFRNCKFHSSSVQTVLPEPIRTANPVFPVPNPLSRPFGSADGLFPYRIDHLFCTGGAFGDLRYRKHPLFCTGGAFDGLWYRKHPSGCTGPVSNPVPCEKPAHFCTRGGGSARSGLNDWRWTAQNRVQREETDCAKQGSTTGGGLCQTSIRKLFQCIP